MSHRNGEIPAAFESERAVLACCFVAPDRAKEFTDQLPISHFHDLRHRAISRAIRSAVCEGAVVDESVVFARADKGDVQPGYLAEIASLRAQPPNFAEHLAILRDKAALRGWLDLREATDRRLASGERAEVLLGEVLEFGRRQLEVAVETVKQPQAKLLADLERRSEDDAVELLRHGYLCRGGGLLLVGPTGIGKSSLAMQAKLAWALGRPLFGITPTRPLTSLLVEAENDEGDLAEMRDGVIAGMQLSESESREAQSRISVCREDTRTSTRFFSEALRPLVEAHKPDLLWIDPALAYLGGEAGSQKDVGGFLRNLLNPILREFDCGCVIIHHTNKPPSGKEKPDWAAGDFAYLGSGSAEWANWARAVLALRSIGQPGVFELRAGKRGGRIGWHDQDGAVSYQRHIGHSPGHICWREAEGEEAQAGGRPKKASADHLLALLPSAGLTSTEWQAKADSEQGIKRTLFFELKRNLESTGRIHQCAINDKWQPVTKRK